VARIRFWTRRVSEITHVLRNARDTVLLLAHDPRRLIEAAALGVPAVLSGTRTAARWSCLASVQFTRRAFRFSKDWAGDKTSIIVNCGIGPVYGADSGELSS
jgi:hypothetical protein